MIRTRSVALFTTVLLGSTGALTAALVTSADAAPAEGTGDVVGLVKEKGGDYLQDVEVEAVDRNGDVAASAFTYESDLDPGQQGFYRLETEPGRYRLVFSRSGYLTQTVSSVRVREGEELELRTVALRPKPKSSETTARIKDARIDTSERGKVEVTVTSTAKVTGEVSVRYGRREVGDAKLRAGDRGTVTVVLDKLDRGTYPLKAYYEGTEGVAQSKSGEVRLTVEKPRRQGHGQGHGHGNGHDAGDDHGHGHGNDDVSRPNLPAVL